MRFVRTRYPSVMRPSIVNPLNNHSIQKPITNTIIGPQHPLTKDPIVHPNSQKWSHNRLQKHAPPLVTYRRIPIHRHPRRIGAWHDRRPPSIRPAQHQGAQLWSKTRIIQTIAYGNATGLRPYQDFIAEEITEPRSIQLRPRDRRRSPAQPSPKQHSPPSRHNAPHPLLIPFSRPVLQPPRFLQIETKLRSTQTHAVSYNRHPTAPP